MNCDNCGANLTKKSFSITEDCPEREITYIGRWCEECFAAIYPVNYFKSDDDESKPDKIKLKFTCFKCKRFINLNTIYLSIDKMIKANGITIFHDINYCINCYNEDINYYGM